MTALDLTLHALDGRPLAATLHTPATSPRAAVVLLGALGVARRFYAPFAAWLAAHGVAVLTFDYRGVGGSRTLPLRRDPATLLDWARLDAAAAIDLACQRWGEVWAVGHSFGGQAIGLTARGLDLAGAVVIAAGSGDMSLYPNDRQRLTFKLSLNLLLPAVSAVLGYVPGRLGLGEDLPVGVVRQWAQWCRTPDYARGALPPTATHHDRIQAPMLFIDFPDDSYAPTDAAAALRGWYARARVTHRVVAPAELGLAKIGHFGGFRPGPTEPLWAEILTTIAGPAPETRTRAHDVTPAA